jgi:predicted permease
MREFFRRIYYLLNRRRLERELQQDIDVHREMIPADDRRFFGNPTLLREQSHEAWGWGWLDRLGQDLRFGVRILRKSPALALTAVVVLALGIGVNVTAFSLANSMFFKRLSVRDPQTLIRFEAKSTTFSSNEIPYPAVVFYGENASTLSAVIAQTSTTLTLTGQTNESVHTGLVSANYFSELGSSAAYGRLFDPKIDGVPEAAPVVVLGYRYWENHFNSDATVVGRPITINQHPATIIGVTAYDFVGLDPEQADSSGLWLMIPQLAYFVPDTKLLTSFDLNDSGVKMSARLKAGATAKAVEHSLQPLSATLAKQHSGVLGEDLRLIAKPGGYVENFDIGDFELLSIFALFGTLMFLILAAACANLGNLLLGHAASRAGEVTIRLQLGATRGRIVRQFMTENLLLAMMGSVAGLLLSWNITRPLVVWLGGPRVLDVSPDWRIWLFTFGLGVISCVLVGLTPARQAARQAHRRSRARTIFMSVQVAASCVLLVVSALMVRALNRAYNSDLGFDYANVITVDPQLYAHGYTAQKAIDYNRELAARLEQAPGVLSSALVRTPPLGHRVSMIRASGPMRVNLHLNEISTRFFETLNIPLLRGRDFTAQDHDKDVAIVSESAARNLWPGKDPLEQIFEFGSKKLRVIGLVANARLTALRNGDDAILYRPFEQNNEVASAVTLVKTSQSPQGLLVTIRGLARAGDRSLSPSVRTLSSTIQERMTDAERKTAMFSSMGGLALVLSIVGLYGVVAYTVAQRTREIGIRIALGATSSLLVRNVLSSFVMPLGCALIAGLGLAALLSTTLRKFLYGLSNWDPLSYGGALLLLGLTGAVAALIPARRALKVDPMVVLRSE